MSLAETKLEAGAKAESALVSVAGQPMPYGVFVDSRVKPMGTFTLDVLHAAVGVSGEAGELLDAAKKHWAYGKPLDRTNMIEELGDLEFYLAALRLVLGVSRHEILQANIDKLVARYPVGYTDAAAIARADKVATLALSRQ